MLVSTSLELVTGVSPWNSSNAVAPPSTYVSPNSTVTGLSPTIVITGGTLSSYPSSVIAAIAPTPAIAINAFCITFSSAEILANIALPPAVSKSTLFFSSIKKAFLSLSWL